MPSAKRITYPPIPKTLMGPAGEISVVMASMLKHPDGDECWGLWDEATRTITLDKSATKRHQWRVLFHELCHVALDDAGLSNGMNDELVEAVCDAVATARMRERFG